MEKEPKKIDFELEGEESDSTEEVESEEEELHTPVLRDHLEKEDNHKGIPLLIFALIFFSYY